MHTSLHPDHNRKRVRLKDYDYSSEGFYCVTICTHNREYLFGEIRENKMVLNALGKIVEQCWLEIPKHFLDVKLDECIVMPNHIHGIVWIDYWNDGKNMTPKNNAVDVLNMPVACRERRSAFPNKSKTR